MSISQKVLVWTWIVPNSVDRADTALLKALEAHEGQLEGGPLPSVTRSQLKRLIEEGKVTVNGNPLKASHKLRPGIEIRIEFPPPKPTELIPENLPIDILYEDEHLIVINKPPGLTVHPSATQMEGTLVHALLYHVKDLSGIGGVLRPGIVHRIDKDTSGALVITKTDTAHVALSADFSKHQLERAYWALSYGTPEISGQDPLKIESLIGRSPTDRKKMSMKVKVGKTAISYIKRIEEYSLPHKKPFASWLEVRLETGRTHQVRVHLHGIGHSILGDPVYGTPAENQPKWKALPELIQSAVRNLPGQALHARTLGFKHPITGKHLRFEATPPPAFQNLQNALKNFL